MTVFEPCSYWHSPWNPFYSSIPPLTPFSFYSDENSDEYSGEYSDDEYSDDECSDDEYSDDEYSHEYSDECSHEYSDVQ